MDDILVPISAGELMDKITILEIKSERIKNPEQIGNIARELAALRAVAERLRQNPLQQPIAALKAVNSKLWDVEDDIRECEARADFGPRFIELARAVYRLNDERARLKRTINEISGSRYVEEKSYHGWNEGRKPRGGA
jgi:hypothetical protein